MTVNGQSVGQMRLKASDAEQTFAFDVPAQLVDRPDATDITLTIIKPQPSSAEQSTMGLSGIRLEASPAEPVVHALPN